MKTFFNKTILIVYRTFKFFGKKIFKIPKRKKNVPSSQHSFNVKRIFPFFDKKNFFNFIFVYFKVNRKIF